MTEKQFKVTNISKNGNTGLFWFGKDNLSVYDIVRLLNELFDENKELKARYNRCIEEMDSLAEVNDKFYKENKELKEEIIKWKSKYFEAMDTVINEYSTNIKEDMEELEKEVWGDVE